MRFADGTAFDPDTIVLATGYKVDLPFLKEDVRKKIIVDPDNNDIKVSNILVYIHQFIIVILQRNGKK